MPVFAQEPLYGEWQLMKIVKDGAEIPLVTGGKTPTIKFAKEGFSGNGSCNSYSGSYTLAGGGKWLAGAIRSTKMACMDGGANTQEANFFAILEKASQYRVSKGSLLLTDSGSQNTLTFLFKDWIKPGEDTRPPEPAEKKLLWIVNKERVDCRSAAPQKCLQVKNMDFEEWQNFYGTIAGFKYRPGKYYLIRVLRTRKPNVPANAPVYNYKLIRVVSRTRLMPHVD